ncbi:MAG TPA: hypothetical protein VKQ08_12070 [Cyclobacteriaceae bacterium]|nr:hypothetical protein [Cyclobacteriaceae bacterium]
MNKNLAVFTLSLLVLATVIGLAAQQFHPSFMLPILTALTVATWLVYAYVQKTKREDFIRNYLLTIVIKLLTGGIFIFTLLYLDQDGAEANAIFFMATYFLLTGLEVSFLFNRLK